MSGTARTERWQQFLADLQQHAAEPLPFEPAGKLTRVAGLVLEASGLNVPVGSLCEIHSPDARAGERPARAEVVGFGGDRAFLMPTDEVHGLVNGATVKARTLPARAPQLGAASHPWRRDADRGLHLPMGAPMALSLSPPPPIPACSHQPTPHVVPSCTESEAPSKRAPHHSRVASFAQTPPVTH